MTQAAWGGLDDNAVPTRYVFDEGHHVFDAADSAFSAALSGLETAELRRWLRGAEGGRSRARGLQAAVEELVADRPTLEAPLDAALQAAIALPPPDWASRHAEESTPSSTRSTRPAQPDRSLPAPDPPSGPGAHRRRRTPGAPAAPWNATFFR